MGLSIEPEASSTITMSSGLGTVVIVFDVEDIAESVVTKSDSSPASTVLSVQIRPTFCVVILPLPSEPAAQYVQLSVVSGSTVTVGPSIPVLDLALASGSMANAAAGNTSTTASITDKRPLVYLLIASPSSRVYTLHQLKVTE